MNSLEDFLEEGAAAKLLQMIEDKKSDCIDVFKKLSMTPDQAVAKARAKAASKAKKAGTEPDHVDEREVKKLHNCEVRNVKQQLAASSQALVRDLVIRIEKDNMIKKAISTGKLEPVTCHLAKLRVDSGHVYIG